MTPDRDVAKLHPDLRMRWMLLEQQMQVRGHPVRLVEGLRSNERQDQLYAQGRTQPGPIVTNARGGQSNHNPGPDGLGRAIDVGFAGPEPFGEHHPWGLLGEQGEAVGLEWGGRWKRPDRPHFQLREET